MRRKLARAGLLVVFVLMIPLLISSCALIITGDDTDEKQISISELSEAMSGNLFLRVTDGYLMGLNEWYTPEIKNGDIEVSTAFAPLVSRASAEQWDRSGEPPVGTILYVQLTAEERERQIERMMSGIRYEAFEVAGVTSRPPMPLRLGMTRENMDYERVLIIKSGEQPVGRGAGVVMLIIFGFIATMCFIGFRRLRGDPDLTSGGFHERTPAKADRVDSSAALTAAAASGVSSGIDNAVSKVVAEAVSRALADAAAEQASQIEGQISPLLDPGESHLEWHLASKRVPPVVRMIPFVPDTLTREKKYLLVLAPTRLLIVRMTNPFNKLKGLEVKRVEASIPWSTVCGISPQRRLSSSSVVVRTKSSGTHRFKDMQLNAADELASRARVLIDAAHSAT